MSAAPGLALALLSAFALNWGWVAQHGAASKLPTLSVKTPRRSLRALFGNLSWLTGFLVGIAGWVLYIAALAYAPLALVQAVSAGGIGILAVLVHRRGDAVTRSHWTAVAVSVGGLVLLAVSLSGGTDVGGRPSSVALAAWLVASVLVAGTAARLSSAAALGAAAGVLYAAGDVATKAATLGGVWLALAAIVLLAHGGAFVVLQLGFQRGGALATAGVSTLLTNALPIVAGLALFHEALPGGPLGTLRVAAFVCVVVGAALLSRRPGSAHVREAPEVDHRRPAAATEDEPAAAPGHRLKHADVWLAGHRRSLRRGKSDPFTQAG